MARRQPRYFENAPLSLIAVMERIGAKVSPGEFIHAVVDAFQEVWTQPEEVMRSRFRRSRSFEDFGALLDRVQARQCTRVLVLGCGAGFGGRSSGFAADVVRNCCAGVDNLKVVSLDLTPQALESEFSKAVDSRFPLIVSHSLAHYIFDLQALAKVVNRALAPGGHYLMANEPNARFWRNPECLKTLWLKESSDRKRKRALRFFAPRRYWGLVVRLARPGKTSDPLVRINQMLHLRFGLSGALTRTEIFRITDPHGPDLSSYGFRLGSNGLDWQDLEEILAPLSLAWIRTSGYLGRDNPRDVKGKWGDLDRRMASLYPLDGCSFSALWRKPAS
jgi:SAM-dependent methyltransferase